MKYTKWMFKGGLHIENNISMPFAEPKQAPTPKKVYIPMSQHIGVPSEIVVQKGTSVALGELIGSARGFMSTNIHSSASGVVTGIEKIFLPNGQESECVVIENDGHDTLHSSIKTVKNTFSIDAKYIIEKMQTSGLVGLGGAAFPTHVKYAPNKDGKKAELIILNGIECEPYISANHALMLTHPQKIISGLKYMLLAANCSKGIIAIEDNKKDAYELISKLADNEKKIEVILCKEKYPQGSEKQLIYSVTGCEVPAGKLPLDVGVIVSNVDTAASLTDAVEFDIPLYQRLITISNNNIGESNNYIVRIGTLYKDLFDSLGINYTNAEKIINGGPMMGFAVPDLNIPVLKNTTGLLIFEHNKELNFPQERHCVRCARCLDSCPMQLEPTTLMHAIKRNDLDSARSHDLSSCIECGSCTYVCPSGIPLVQYFRLGKQFLANNGYSYKNPAFELKEDT